MKLLDLPQFERFRGERNVKVLRHADSRFDLWKLREQGKEFERYQNGNSRDLYRGAQYLISFIAEPNRLAKFVGVWQVLSKRPRMGKVKGFRYRTVELPDFKDLEGRLIINWGEGAKSYCQWLHRKGNKDVVEILPPNSAGPFPGYYDIQLRYDKLQEIVNHPDSNRQWQQPLASHSGVYLILDPKSGKQYVGSVYGKGGIWSRWKCYAKSPSGGNKFLKDLLKKDPGRYRSFQFSIMHVLEPSTVKADVLAQEALMKKKLGSRATGLNC